MFCPEKNAYLQLVSAMEPRVINKAVRRAMLKKKIELDEDLPPAERQASMEQFLFGYQTDVTSACVGYGRNGLRLVIRELNSDDTLVKQQAIISLLDLVQIPQNALYAIELNVVNRLIDLMMDPDHIVREKVALILTSLANTYQGIKRIMSRPIFIEHLIYMIVHDRKEVRYTAALCLKTLTRDRCACDTIMKNDNIVDSLLKMIKNDHTAIVVYHINSLKNLSEWDPVKPLKANAFQIMRQLIHFFDFRVVQAALDCMTQLCKHYVGKQLADKYDMTRVLLYHLMSPDIEVILSTVGLMAYTTLTPMSRWRAREFACDLVKRLVTLTIAHNIPVLQIRAMQVIINLCESPDIKAEVKKHWNNIIVRGIKIRNSEIWEGTSETTTFGLESGCNYETMCIETVDTIKEDFGEDAFVVDKHSYLSRVRNVKANLIRAINSKPSKTDLPRVS